MVLAKKVQKCWKWGPRKIQKVEKTWRFIYPGLLFLKIGFSVQFLPNLFHFIVNFVIFFNFWKNFTFYLPKSGKNASFVNDRFGVAGSTDTRILGIFRPVPCQWKIITYPFIGRFQRFFCLRTIFVHTFQKKIFEAPVACVWAHVCYMDGKNLFATFPKFTKYNGNRCELDFPYKSVANVSGEFWKSGKWILVA